MLLGDLQELVDFVFLQDLRGEELLVVVAELLMVGNEHFERPFDPIQAGVAISVGFGHKIRLAHPAVNFVDVRMRRKVL